MAPIAPGSDRVTATAVNLAPRRSPISRSAGPGDGVSGNSGCAWPRRSIRAPYGPRPRGEEHHRCRNDFRLDPRQAERRLCDRLPPTGRNRAMLNVAKHDFKSQEDRCDVVAFGLQIF
jgi:hypothetical protein